MTEQQLVKYCIEGRKEAQESLYNKYAAEMLGICYRYTKCIEDAEDVLQEGFIKVFTRMEQFRQECNLGGWIRTIMVNTAITYINKHSRYRKELQVNEQVLHVVTEHTAEINVETKELIEMIRELPTGYQCIFNLAAIEGYSLTEIAKLLNMNGNTVRSKYSRARTMLMEMINKHNEEKKIKYGR